MLNCFVAKIKQCLDGLAGITEYCRDVRWDLSITELQRADPRRASVVVGEREEVP